MTDRSSLALESILVVDDQTLMRDVVVAICSTIGFPRVVAASNGTEAIRLMRDEAFQIVLSDWKMKPVSGLDLLNQVRADLNLHKTKFLMMTTHANQDLIIAAKKIGADGCILKPFSGRALQDKITRILGDHSS